MTYDAQTRTMHNKGTIIAVFAFLSCNLMIQFMGFGFIVLCRNTKEIYLKKKKKQKRNKDKRPRF